MTAPKITMWFDVKAAFGKRVIGTAMDLLDPTTGSITEIIGEQYCVEFSVSNTMYEIDNVENWMLHTFPDINLTFEVELA